MNAKPSRSALLILLPLTGILMFILLGCAPCCCWFPGGGNNGHNTGGNATVSGTAIINMNNVKQPVPEVKVIMGVSNTNTSKYETITDKDGHFVLNNIEPGTYFIRISGGDLGWTDTINVAKGATMDLGDVALHPTLPPPPNVTTDKYPATPEDVIKAYYQAINNGDYTKALSYLSGQMGGEDENAIRAIYEPYVKNIQLVSITHQTNMDYNGRSVYDVKFDVQYIQHYPAGSGNLPEVHAMMQVNGLWKIVEIGTG
jgi:hypothetical protein